MSMRSFVRMGSYFSVFRNVRFGSTLSVIDWVQLGSTLSPQSFA
jgi:hypothetical protein